MPSALPILLLAGGAIMLMAGGKKKKKKPLPSLEVKPSTTVPDISGDEDLDKKDDEGKLPKQPVEPGPTPEPGPTIPTEPTEPGGKPAMGPSGAGTCASGIYSSDPQYINPAISDVLSAQALTAFPESKYFFYIRPNVQAKLYNAIGDRFSKMMSEEERKTVASVVLREELKRINSGCEWEAPIDSLGKPEQLVWSDGVRLLALAQMMTGFRDPSSASLFETGSRLTVSKKSLGEPDPGFMGSSNKQGLIGRRTELIATDEGMASSEHIIGEIVKLNGPSGEPDQFEVRIVDRFRGNDVTPQLRSKHGFKTGSNAYFSQRGPTGIYRIFPEGMV